MADLKEEVKSSSPSGLNLEGEAAGNEGANKILESKSRQQQQKHRGGLKESSSSHCLWLGSANKKQSEGLENKDQEQKLEKKINVELVKQNKANQLSSSTDCLTNQAGLAVDDTSGKDKETNYSQHSEDKPLKPKEKEKQSVITILCSKRQVSAVKSLESSAANSNNSNSNDNASQGSFTPPAQVSKSIGDRKQANTTTSGYNSPQSSRQMFSLRQLAINSRNLTKKRPSIQQQTQNNSNQVTPTYSANNTTSSSGSPFSRFTSERSSTKTRSSSSKQNDTCETENDNNNYEHQEQEDVDDVDHYLDEEGDDELNDEENEQDVVNQDGSSDSEGEDTNGSSLSSGSVSGTSSYDDDDDGNSNGDGDEGEITLGDKNKIKKMNKAPGVEDKERGASCGSSKRKRNKSRRKRVKSSAPFRRPSSCNCEPLINKIDFDGLPVTDVDLVTYKDLCHMEQQVHHMRTTAATINRSNKSKTNKRLVFDADSQSTSSASYLCSLSNNNNQNNRSNSLRPAQIVARRSSLQEESGAYYQLCTSSEEQAIRAKYSWFPPSLKQLVLVDNFFQLFPKEKIPFLFQQSEQQNENTDQPKQQDNNNMQTTAATTTTTVGCKQLLAPQKVSAPSVASSSYRDEQISFQLPKQDISLDYCSYPLDELSRQAYNQFIDKRNSKALDVGCVVQIKSNNLILYEPKADSPSNSENSATGSSPSSKHSSMTKERFSRLNNSSNRQRKGSTVSCQSAMTMLALSNHQQQVLFNQHQQANNAAGTSGGVPQRCRRCLVRFEYDQLAIVAPNFIIGSALYRPTIIPSSAQPQQQAKSFINQFPPASSYSSYYSPASSISRRASSTTVPTTSRSFCLDGPSTSITLSGKEDGDTQSYRRGPTTNNNPHLAQPELLNNVVALFHPNCFTCSTCKEFLVDLVYCLRDNRLYCLRHYGESLRPRCSWCQELIFSDEYLKAMNESFHVDHFLCRHCDCNLAGQRYVLKDEKPFCIQCYEGNFANICEDCQKPIGIDSRDLSYKERHWHDTCFLCNKCQQSLIDKPFGSKADKVYCADCYDLTFATRCDGCQNPFRAGSKKMEYRGRQWHDSCFCCFVCQNTIGSNSFIPKNDDIYCIKCYEDKYATRCTKCKQVIVSGGVTFRNEPWHRDCFNCCNCNKSLAGQRFTTRDVTNETVKNTNKTNQPHNAYCIDCYGELFAKRCFACTQAITGLGGTRFVTFEDRSWHNDCFVCSDCTTSLVGKGFITDGPETILCSDCARAKLR